MRRLGLAVITVLLLFAGSATAERAPTNLKAVPAGPHSIRATWTPAVGIAAQTIAASPFGKFGVSARGGLGATATEQEVIHLVSGSYAITVGSCQLALVQEACSEYYSGGLATTTTTTTFPKGWYVNENSLFEEPIREVGFEGIATVKFPGTPIREITCRMGGGGHLQSTAGKNYLSIKDETFYACNSALPEEGASCGPGVHFEGFITAKENNRNAEDGGEHRKLEVEERSGKQFLNFEEEGKPSKGHWFVVQPCVGTEGTETKLTPNAESGKGSIELSNHGGANGIPLVKGSVEVNDTVRNVPMEWNYSIVTLKQNGEAYLKTQYEH